MIPRTLVPLKLAPVDPQAERPVPRKVSSILDERTLIPARLPFIVLDPHSSIPDHLPLEVLSARILVSREADKGTLELPPAAQAWPASDMDERIAVPLDAHPAAPEVEAHVPFEQIEDLLEPDVMTTGNVNLMPREVSGGAKEQSPLVPLMSVGVHAAFALLLFLIAAIFPAHQPTQAELDFARRQLGVVYLPNSLFSEPKSAPNPQPPGPRVQVDPRILREVAPAPPAAQPSREVPREAPSVARELPNAPMPAEQTPRAQTPNQSLHIEPPKQLPDAPAALALPRLSVGRAIDDSLHGAARGGGGTRGYSFGGRVGGGSGGGGGGGTAQGGLEMLTPDEGVDFSSYLQRVLIKVRQNWYAVIPESARLGERGVVVLEFRIFRDGTVPPPEPDLISTSGRDPLDHAAESSIGASNPFEPLPSAFSAPFIKLRFTYLYNIPIESYR
jgi:uncharacterized membrane protein YgcG